MSRRKNFVGDCSVPLQIDMHLGHVRGVLDGTCATLNDNACLTEFYWHGQE
jgi:hypothetical protein